LENLVILLNHQDIHVLLLFHLLLKQKKKFLLKNQFNWFLPNLKQVFEGQSTGFCEHVLSAPVQHWIEYIPAVLCITLIKKKNIK